MDGTVPSSKKYLDGTVPSSKKYMDGTVPSSMKSVEGTVLSSKKLVDGKVLVVNIVEILENLNNNLYIFGSVAWFCRTRFCSN